MTRRPLCRVCLMIDHHLPSCPERADYLICGEIARVGSLYCEECGLSYLDASEREAKSAEPRERR